MTSEQADLVVKLIDAKVAEWSAQHSEYGHGMEHLASMRLEEALRATTKEDE